MFTMSKDLQSWPASARVGRQVGEAGDDDAVGVLVQGLDPHAVAAGPVDVHGGRVVGAHKHLAVPGPDEAEVGGILGISVVDEAAVGINIVVVFRAKGTLVEYGLAPIF
jgi:hypothetical protein